MCVFNRGVASEGVENGIGRAEAGLAPCSLSDVLLDMFYST